MDWPNKNQRENYEINEFIEAYKKLHYGCSFKIHNKSEKPDYILKDANYNYFGVELTSVYLDDRSVPDEHMKEDAELIEIPYSEETINKYLTRIKESIEYKTRKAKSGYNLSFPIILGMYINEYILIYIHPKDWELFINDNKYIFEFIYPFKEIILFSLQNNGCISIYTEINSLIIKQSN